MSGIFLALVVVAAVVLLLLLVLRLKINAFIALIITAMFVGIASGMPFQTVLDSIQKGMGGTLGFVATVVGLGAIFGQMLESSGGAEALARYLVKKFGHKKAPYAMVLSGFFIGIPVFFDVGFIILIPIVYALARDTKLSLLYYGIPLLAGLAVTHSFIPPTPGPVAVAEIINAQLGYVILFGFLLGIPVAILAGPVFGRYISKKIMVAPPDFFEEANTSEEKLPPFGQIIWIILIPLILILLATITNVMVTREVIGKGVFPNLLMFVGHPFSALIIATLVAIYFLGIRRGFKKKEILDLSTKALGPAGIIILVTGAGGALKEVLVDSGIGDVLAGALAKSAWPPVLLAWALAALVRVTQGSATVAMITAAGIMAPLLVAFDLSEMHRALIVLAISSGATILSHVNDSGFWLVGKYLGLDEKQTLQSWTVMETIIAVSGLALTLLVSFFV
ncbi:GntP family permease [Alkalitalea saponilacus]|uniref:Gnt-I system low-affinity gluconate transporter n=1 Tax=Alkalitalea saponilacus TaxID=889453 RepID=A0A1T5AKN5_9BACT|nr:gluconate:H+ symporter [Alkalitalea saponilacus]ASB48667.1 gluconate transporter [Alkalitalea saponilacus]SKB35591.1 Gnt-I system low-affinity gluconate transporter [Alkalitalea saponilacus]